MKRNRKIVVVAVCSLLAVGGGLVVANFLAQMTGYWTFAPYEVPCLFVPAADSQQMNIVISPDGLGFTGVFPYLTGEVIFIEEIVGIALKTGHSLADLTFVADGVIGNGPYGAELKYSMKVYFVNSTHEILVLHWTHAQTGTFNDIIPVNNVNVQLTENSTLKGELFRQTAINPVSFHIDVDMAAPS